MRCVESRNSPYLNEFHTVKRRYTSFNRCSLILYLNNTLEFFGTLQCVHRFARNVCNQVGWSVLAHFQNIFFQATKYSAWCYSFLCSVAFIYCMVSQFAETVCVDFWASMFS